MYDVPDWLPPYRKYLPGGGVALEHLMNMSAGEVPPGETRLNWAAMQGAVATLRRLHQAGLLGPLTAAATATGPKSRTGDPSTSKKAADKNKLRRGAQYERITAFVANAPRGVTASDISEGTGIRLNSASTRLPELERGGWVEVAGERNGRSTYVPTPKAIAAYRRP